MTRQAGIIRDHGLPQTELESTFVIRHGTLEVTFHLPLLRPQRVDHAGLGIELEGVVVIGNRPIDVIASLLQQS